VIYVQVGFFDSGAGGITVLYEALKIMPCEDYIYYADTLNVPYGPKPKEEVRKYVLDAAEFMAGQGIKALVIACNTATSIAIEDLRRKYDFPIIGMEPAVKPAVEKNGSRSKRVLVLATQLTIKEEKLRNLIDRVDSEGIVDLLALPGLVEYAEKMEFEKETVMPYLKEQLSSFNMNNYGTVVLGCTHFPLYKDMFRELLPEGVDIIDGSIGTVKNLKRILENTGRINEGSGQVVYYNSGRKVTDNAGLQKFQRLFKRLDDISG